MNIFDLLRMAHKRKSGSNNSVLNLMRKTLRAVIFLCGLISIIDAYMSIFEYNFSISEISLHEVVFLYLMFVILRRHYRVCKGNNLSIWETIRRPFNVVGYFNLGVISIFAVGLMFGILTIDGLISYDPTNSFLNQMLSFGVIILSFYAGIPKVLPVKLDEKKDNLSVEASS
tara:strand:+ start:263 stop:778 length:516 start_codon:yes stop_codon:yes gene_type:complete